MRGAQTMRAIACATAVMAGAAGCTGTTIDGAAEPTRRNIDEIIVFNVCRDPGLSDQILLDAGLDPTTKMVITDPPEGVSTFRVCNWGPVDGRYGPTNYRVSVFSTSHTLQELRKKETVILLRETTVNGRRGQVSKERNDPESCYVSFDAEQGMFQVRVGWLSEYESKDGNLCEIAAQHAARLEPHLPR
ncbi:DUF3558 domain-containing protein [Nocardia sp. 004]|uniref:DUF3558 domain-containing protein n=1 Tax=Nocardia sp. 004 TaxID=3385978 RepID=UPI0039A31A2C